MATSAGPSVPLAGSITCPPVRRRSTVISFNWSATRSPLPLVIARSVNREGGSYPGRVDDVASVGARHASPGRRAQGFDHRNAVQGTGEACLAPTEIWAADDR